MSSGRIEMPLEEYNGMKSKIDEFEKILNKTSKDASKHKEENELMKKLLSEISIMKVSERIFNWEDIKEKIDEILKDN